MTPPRLTPAQAAKARELYASGDGLTLKAIAARFGCSIRTIRNAVKGVKA